MIHIISDYKTNIKHVFTLLESYFINNGEYIVPLICNISDEMEFLFYEMEHVSPLFATFIIVSWFISYQTVKNNIKHDFILLESYFINNGEDIVPFICNISDEMEFLFYEMEHVSPLLATFVLFSWFISYQTTKPILNMFLLY